MTKYQILTIFKDTIDLSNGLEEILRERIYHYKKFSIPLDFWFFKNLKVNNYHFNKKTDKHDSYTLITTNKVLVNWLKLRYGYFEEVNNITNLDLKYTLDGYLLILKNLNNLPLKSFLLQ